MISKLPYYKQQTPFTCSLACLRMVLESIGRKFTEMELARIIGFGIKIGFSPAMMNKLCEIVNIEYEYHFDATLNELKELVANGFYPIVLVKAHMIYPVPEAEHGHYIVVKYITKEDIIINDPDQEYGGENKQIDLKKFLEAWCRSHNLIFVIKGEKK